MELQINPLKLKNIIKAYIYPAMSNPSNSQQIECFVCGSLHEKTKLLPCSHEGLCLDCIRSLSKPRCPFCRSTIHHVQTEDGKEFYEDLRAEYLEVEKRDLEKTVQLYLVGPNVRENHSILDVLLEHGQYNAGNQKIQTKFSANCSFDNSKSNLTVQPVPETIGSWSNVDRFEADAIAIIVHDLDETTYEKFRACHSKVASITRAPVVLLLKHDGNLISACVGETIKELLEHNSGPSFPENFSKLFIPLVKATESRKWTRDEAGDIYALLWDIGKLNKMNMTLFVRAMYFTGP